MIEVRQCQLLEVTEKICNDPACRYPQLALRVLLHVMAGLDAEGTVFIHTKQFAQKLGVNYCTLGKCLRYLREIGILLVDR